MYIPSLIPRPSLSKQDWERDWCIPCYGVAQRLCSVHHHANNLRTRRCHTPFCLPLGTTPPPNPIVAHHYTRSEVNVHDYHWCVHVHEA